MPEDAAPILQYANPSQTRRRPTRHCALAGAAWVVLILETAFRGTVVAIAYHRSPTYPWERFSRNVGDSDVFRAIDNLFFYVGASVALIALLWPNRKRWIALLALIAHLFLLAAKGNLMDALSRY